MTFRLKIICNHCFIATETFTVVANYDFYLHKNVILCYEENIGTTQILLCSKM